MVLSGKNVKRHQLFMTHCEHGVVKNVVVVLVVVVVVAELLLLLLLLFLIQYQMATAVW